MALCILYNCYTSQPEVYLQSFSMFCLTAVEPTPGGLRHNDTYQYVMFFKGKEAAFAMQLS